jgi:hypothetical protein
MKYLFYEYKGRTSKADLAGFVALAAEFPVNKKTVSAWNQMLVGDGVRGGSAFFVDLEYDNNAALRVFLDASGNTRPSTQYISIARTAVAQSVLGDSDAQCMAKLALVLMIVVGEIPVCTKKSRTASARRCESCKLYVCVPMSSVYP